VLQNYFYLIGKTRILFFTFAVSFTNAYLYKMGLANFIPKQRLMNHSKKVITLILVVTSIHLLLSIFSKEFIEQYPYFKNVNLLSDILVKEKVKKEAFKNKEVESSVTEDSLPKNEFEAYEKKDILIRFNADTIAPALPKLAEKLIALSEGKNVKIRIAWFGDSQIEGDFITQDVREQLQNYFGQQKGVGYVPISCISSDFRRTAKVFTTGELNVDNFKKQEHNCGLFLSGYSFFSNNLEVIFKDNVKKSSTQITQKWLLYGKGDSISVKINDSVRKYAANSEFNRILVGSGVSNKAKFTVSAKRTPIFGVSSEPKSGIVLDNYSFRGISGMELKKINSNLLAEISKSGYYDLIVFQYGVNLMFQPNDTNYDYYYRGMRPVIKKFQNNMPNTEFLLFSCSDRAFNYDGEWKTAVGIDSLIHTQARLAFDTDIPFYNFYKSIGGSGTIVKWADSTVQYANKDYIHFNYKGAKAVSKIIFKALLNDYQKAVLQKKAGKQMDLPKVVVAKTLVKETIRIKKDTPKSVTPKVELLKQKVVKEIIPKEVVPKPPVKKGDSI
jgi:lysophospholipase L1-like esterase